MINYIFSILPSLFSGATLTIEIFVWTTVVSLPLGLLVAFGLLSNIRLLKAILKFYVWVIRGTPLLLQLIFIFYGLPTIGIVFPRYESALIAFIINYAAYFAEIFRGGLQAIPKGQIEAANVLGLSHWQTVYKIIRPQVFKIVLPSIGNELINLVKDSSLVYVIGLGDLLRAGNVATARDVSLVPLVLVGVVYLAMTAILTYILRKVEKRSNVWK
ncbi:amino acid ABC transporter permease [Lactobacillus hominis]|uniref:amino acid ABC transporter permease n=1 Tax=Lactobacillus hominis TaxID=1203033 RepID=UPI0023F1F766|nr:amino acid ABC transporter permease [Lactobacillus hominis]